MTLTIRQRGAVAKLRDVASEISISGADVAAEQWDEWSEELEAIADELDRAEPDPRSLYSELAERAPEAGS